MKRDDSRFKRVGEKNIFEQMMQGVLREINSKYMDFHSGLDVPMRFSKGMEEKGAVDKKKISGLKGEKFLDRSSF